MNNLLIVNEQVVLEKNFKVYGDIENPLFLAKDVAEWIDYSKTGKGAYDVSKMLKTLDDDEKTIRTIFVSEQKRDMWFVTEDGLYEILMLSRKPIAKQFKKEVKKILKELRATTKALETIEFKGNICNLIWSKDGKPITTSNAIAELTGKEHKNVIRDIEDEINKLNKATKNACEFKFGEIDEKDKLKYELISNNELDAYATILNDIKEITYTDKQNRQQKAYQLGETATMQIMLRYNAKFRALFIFYFQQMRIALENMFKARVIEQVLPQDNRLRQFVYVIKNPLNETVKIGVAHDVQKRIKQLETGAGIELELIYQSLLCSNAFEVEKEAHNYFAEHRTFGEWFKVDANKVINFLENKTYVLNSDFNKYISLIH